MWPERFLDIPDVAHVVNYDMPLKIENYSHRMETVCMGRARDGRRVYPIDG